MTCASCPSFRPEGSAFAGPDRGKHPMEREEGMEMRPYPNDGLLGSALLANAVFSIFTGIAALWFAPVLVGSLGGLSVVEFRVLGVALLVFAGGVAILGTRQPIPALSAALVTLADLGWVLASAALLAFHIRPWTPAGEAVVAGVAGVVALVALGQTLGLLRYARNVDGRTDARSRFSISRTVPARADVVWSRLSALDRIGEHHGALSEVEVEFRDGVQRRTCSTDDGGRWSEEVLVMDRERRELILDFDFSEGRMPLPAEEMIGGWLVEDAPRGSRLTLWYEYTLRGGLAGELLAALTDRVLRRQMTPAIESIGADPVR